MPADDLWILFISYTVSLTKCVIIITTTTIIIVIIIVIIIHKIL